MTSSFKVNYSYFKFFYQELGYRMFISWGFTLIMAVLDGFGLTMFLPLLQLVSGESVDPNINLGGLDFLVEFFKAIGIELNLSSVLLIILAFFLAKGLTFFVQSYYNVLVRLFFIRQLRFGFVDGLAAMRYKAFVEKDAGRIQNTMSSEVGRVMSAYTGFMNTLQAWVLLFVYVVLAFVTDPQFALFIVIGGAFSNIAYRKVYAVTKGASKKVTRGGHVFQRQLLQMVAHFKYMKATALLEPYGEKLKVSVAYIERAQKRIGVFNSILAAIKEPINVIVVVGIILIQVTYFNNNVGTILLSLLFFYRALSSIVSVQTYWNTFLNSSGSVENLRTFKKELETDKEIEGDQVITDFRWSIRLKDVHFRFGETDILKNVSLAISKNETLAFVGESGSGKTTLLNIIAGLFPVDSGEVSIDNHNYTSLDSTSLQKRIGYITQDPVILTETIYNNVTLWDDATPGNLERFWKALRKASVLDFVKALPKQENSLLGNNGIQLSGGQKQRISIARELYKEVDILILDEATSALDSETEMAIQKNLEALKGQYTFILVAHRLSTIRQADKIYLIKEGQILDSGTFSQLQENSADFKRMTQLQEL